MITSKWIDDLLNATGVDLKSILLDYESFYTNNYTFVQEYYSGKLTKADPISFDKLNKLKIKIDRAIIDIEKNSNSLQNYRYWEMLELIEGLKIDVDTVLNLPKWLRSTIEKARFKPLSENITLKQNQTLEGLTRDIGDSNWRENWFNLAINNNLQEEDYTSEGGNLLSVTLVTGQVLQLDSVVDTINEDTILGKDLDKKLSFEDNDLKVLNSKDTFYQSVLIASSLRKGQNSSLPELGLPREVFGINKNILNYPSIIRRITESMKTDDTIKTINIEDISLEQDGVKITLGVNSILDDFKIQRSLFI